MEQHAEPQIFVPRPPVPRVSNQMLVQIFGIQFLIYHTSQNSLPLSVRNDPPFSEVMAIE